MYLSPSSSLYHSCLHMLLDPLLLPSHSIVKRRYVQIIKNILVLIIVHQPLIFNFPAVVIGLFMVATKVFIFTQTTSFIWLTIFIRLIILTQPTIFAQCTIFLLFLHNPLFSSSRLFSLSPRCPDRGEYMYCKTQCPGCRTLNLTKIHIMGTLLQATSVFVHTSWMKTFSGQISAFECRQENGQSKDNKVSWQWLQL